MSASAIRAGGAFVEMFIKDEQVQASLARVKTQLVAFGGAVNAVGAQSFAGMNAVATTSLTGTSASVGILTAAMGLLRATVIGVGVAFKSAFNILTVSVSRVVVMIGAAAALLARFAPASRMNMLLGGFLRGSATTEALGRWTRFFGLLTGSQALRGLGNRIERLGLGSSIVAGIRNGGLFGGIQATMGAAFRSTKSIIATTLGSILTSPIRLLRSTLSSSVAATATVAPGLTRAAVASNALAGGLTKASVASKVLAASGTGIGVFAAALMGLATKAAFIGTAISAPALIAAKKFVTAAKEITDEAATAGKSVKDLITARFGSNSMISESDIKAGVELGKVMKELKQQSSAAFAQIGIAALPILKKLTESSLWVANALTQVLARNRDLITSVVNVASRVAGAVGAFLLLKTVMAAAVPIVAMLVSPIGLVAAGIVGLIYLVPQLRAGFLDTISFLKEKFEELGQTVNTTMAGIGDALMGGNLKLAADILWAGLKLAWLQGTSEIRDLWNSTTNKLAKTWFDFMAGVKSIVALSVLFIGDSFAAVFNTIASLWKATQNKIAEGIIRSFAYASGTDPKDQLATLAEMQRADEAKTKAGIAAAQNEREKAFNARMTQIEEEAKAIQGALDDELAGRRAAAATALQEAKDNLAALREQAAKEKPLPSRVNAEAAAAGFSSVFGTFSATSAARSGAGGIESLKDSAKKTADNTAVIAANTKNGLAFA